MPNDTTWLEFADYANLPDPSTPAAGGGEQERPRPAARSAAHDLLRNQDAATPGLRGANPRAATDAHDFKVNAALVRGSLVMIFITDVDSSDRTPHHRKPMRSG